MINTTSLLSSSKNLIIEYLQNNQLWLSKNVFVGSEELPDVRDTYSRARSAR